MNFLIFYLLSQTLRYRQTLGIWLLSKLRFIRSIAEHHLCYYVPVVGFSLNRFSFLSPQLKDFLLQNLCNATGGVSDRRDIAQHGGLSHGAPEVHQAVNPEAPHLNEP